MQAYAAAIVFSSHEVITYILPPVLIFAVFAFIRLLDTNSFIRWEKAMRLAAEKTGMIFTNRCGPVMKNPSNAMNRTLYLGLAMRFMLNLTDLSLEGTYRDYGISIRFTSRKGSDTDGEYEYTMMEARIFFNSPLPYDIIITPKDPGIVKSLTRGNRLSADGDIRDYISMGNAASNKVSAILDSEGSCNALRDIYRVFPTALIDNRGFMVKRRAGLNKNKPWNFKNDFDWIINRMNEFYRAASRP